MASEWRDEKTLTDFATLQKEIPGGPSKYHDPKLRHVEEELLEHYKDYCDFCNRVCVDDPDAGKRLWNLDDMKIFDIMGQVPRGKFGPHYDKVTPYLKDAHVAFKDLDIIAFSETTAYATSIQRYWGTATDGAPFDLHFRTTSILKKDNGNWSMIHEHLSFPCDMATLKADPTSGITIDDSLSLKK